MLAPPCLLPWFVGPFGGHLSRRAAKKIVNSKQEVVKEYSPWLRDESVIHGLRQSPARSFPRFNGSSFALSPNSLVWRFFSTLAWSVHRDAMCIVPRSYRRMINDVSRYRSNRSNKGERIFHLFAYLLFTTVSEKARPNTLLRSTNKDRRR